MNPASEPLPLNVAIVGMAGRFPEANNVAQLWDNVCQGRESVRQFSTDELLDAGIPHDVVSDPGYIPFGVEIDGIDLFDAEFFRMTPAEAAHCDPQQRLFLECAWRALEDAGVRPGGRVGVFAALAPNYYLGDNVMPAGRHIGVDLPLAVRLGNYADFLASRLSYAFDLTGPAVAVQSACSSALVTVDSAVSALLAGRCDAAVAGASALRLPQPSGYRFVEGGTLSREGRTRPFDAQASGWVTGGGAAVVVLKRLADAVADRDQIYAVIKGVGVTNDGARKVSFAAPNLLAQRAAMTDAIAASGVPTTEIGYIEAHGSGTSLGDAIEIGALTQAYQAAHGFAPGCGLGSVKANIGHLDIAAGVAGLVKAVLVLRHHMLPPQINCETPNPLLRLDRTGLVLHDRLTAPTAPLKAAAVSAMGMGGTNVHIVLSAGQSAFAAGELRPPVSRSYELQLSARNDAELVDVARSLHAHLGSHPVRIDDLAFTLNSARAIWPTGLRFQASSVENVRRSLAGFIDGHPGAVTPRSTGEGVQDPDNFAGAIKVDLPGYPLRRSRHWIEVEPPNPETCQKSLPLGAATSPTSGPDGNGRPLEENITDIFRVSLGVPSMGPDDHFDAMHGTSLAALEIVDTIADQIGPVVGLGTFLALGTPRRIAEEIRSWPGANVVDPVTVRLRDGESKQHLFLLYPATGTAFCYHKMALHTELPGPAWAISYPFEDADPPATLVAMASRCVQEIRAIDPHGPYRLGGYSFGANLAVETAYQLGELGATVSDITMIDGSPLEAFPRHYSATDYLRAAPLALSYFLGLEMPNYTPESAGTVDGALAALRRPNWSVLTEQTMRRSVEMIARTGMALSEAPRRAPITANLTVLTAATRHNPVFDMIGVQNLPGRAWQQYTTGTVTVTDIPGDHYTLYSTPQNFDRLCAELKTIYQ
ncbi:beta-ketoacyl synthase N-terminal-like domain-containing protein [Mycolicibacterium boenickei]